MEVIDHGVVKERLDPPACARHVLQIEEDAGVGDQLVDLGVERALARVRQMVDGKAGKHGVEAPVDPRAPGRGAEVGFDRRGAGAELLQARARSLEHVRRKIDRHAFGIRKRLERSRQDQAVAGAEVQDAPRRAASQIQSAEHHFELLRALGDVDGDLVQKTRGHVAPLPDLG